MQSRTPLVSTLPGLTAVVISHAHFDHLAFSSLDELRSRTSLLVVPPVVREYLPAYSVEIQSLPQWSSRTTEGVTITAVPVVHAEGRYGLDESSCTSCVSGFVFEHDRQTVYFGGDSAYAPTAFWATRDRFPRIDLAILPICPIAPRDLMQRVHMDPDEALQAFKDLGASRMMPIHFDTFINSDDKPGDCRRALREAMTRRGTSASSVVELEIGEQRVLEGTP